MQLFLPQFPDQYINNSISRYIHFFPLIIGRLSHIKKNTDEVSNLPMLGGSYNNKDAERNMMLIWDHLGPFGTICEYLGTFGTIWDHLGTFGNI